ncbi:unnamed protein product [Cochlearia groenlandica]
MERDEEATESMMEMCTNGAEDTSNNKRPIISGEPIDVEAYAALYKGRTKITRLLFIANHCEGNNNTIQLEALRMAYDEIKKGENTKLFRDVVNMINGKLGDKYAMDSSWCNTIDRRAELKKVKLESELSSYRTNLIKESIRMGYNDFGDFYYACGLLGESFKNYVRTRDYCTTAKHIIHMCMNAILVSIEMGQFNLVTNYVNKADQIPETLDPVVVAKLRCASGLAHLEVNKYKLAARKFLDVNPELGNSYNEVIAPQDVATYGGLCALASFDRSELKAKVIDNINFRDFLELVPEVRELINDFYSSRYASCLEYLESLKANLLLDIHLHDHVDTLYEQIRKKALIQYTLPFVSVDLTRMADAFKTNVSGLEKELEALITDNQIQARIDSHNKILFARNADKRNATFQKVLQMGNEFDRDSRAMMLRASLLKHEHHAKAARKF